MQRVVGIFLSLGTRWQLGRTHFAWGELAVAQADGVAARDHFTRVQHLFAAMQAAPDLARTERLGKACLIDDNLRAVLQGSLTGNLTVALRQAGVIGKLPFTS